MEFLLLSTSECDLMKIVFIEVTKFVYMSPQNLCVKGVLARMAPMKGDGTFRRWDLLGGPWVTGAVSLKTTVGPWFLPFPLCFLSQEASSLVCMAMGFHHDVLPTLKAQSNGLLDLGMKPLKSRAKENSTSLS